MDGNGTGLHELVCFKCSGLVLIFPVVYLSLCVYVYRQDFTKHKSYRKVTSLPALC